MVIVPSGSTLTPIVLMEVKVLSRLMLYFVVNFPCVRFVLAGVSVSCPMVAFPCLSHTQWTRYQKHLGKDRLPPVE